MGVPVVADLRSPAGIAQLLCSQPTSYVFQQVASWQPTWTTSQVMQYLQHPVLHEGQPVQTTTAVPWEYWIERSLFQSGLFTWRKQAYRAKGLMLVDYSRKLDLVDRDSVYGQYILLREAYEDVAWLHDHSMTADEMFLFNAKVPLRNYDMVSVCGTYALIRRRLATDEQYIHLGYTPEQWGVGLVIEPVAPDQYPCFWNEPLPDLAQFLQHTSILDAFTDYIQR